jgi:REP element-mobilizing transposase RayT
MPEPIYTAANVRLAYELRWSVAVFWAHTAPAPASWLGPLQEVTESDGVRILEHHLTKGNVSQFLVSTKPDVAPADCMHSVKGRLQHLVRGALPKAFRRNYSIRSLGAANQKAIEGYVAAQLQHHPMADPRIDAMLAPFQFADNRLDLGRPRHSSHGEFIYNLHLVAVHEQRFGEARENFRRQTSEMLRGAADRKNHLLSRVGLLPDHVHWTVGCGIEQSPLDVGLSYLNNLAYAHGMRPLFQFGFYVGTFGAYDLNAVRRSL